MPPSLGQPVQSAEGKGGGKEEGSEDEEEKEKEKDEEIIVIIVTKYKQNTNNHWTSLKKQVLIIKSTLTGKGLNSYC